MWMLFWKGEGIRTLPRAQKANSNYWIQTTNWQIHIFVCKNSKRKMLPRFKHQIHKSWVSWNSPLPFAPSVRSTASKWTFSRVFFLLVFLFLLFSIQPREMNFQMHTTHLLEWHTFYAERPTSSRMSKMFGCASVDEAGRDGEEEGVCKIHYISVRVSYWIEVLWQFSRYVAVSARKQRFPALVVVASSTKCNLVNMCTNFPWKYVYCCGRLSGALDYD